MFRCWGPHWGWVPCAPTPWLLLSLLVCSAPFGLQGEETRQGEGLKEPREKITRRESILPPGRGTGLAQAA
uniref:Glycosylated lysosomal membrane protein n=1 Tax=Mus musculus TaxID=10090 RepID=D6RJI7_MOUSE